MDGGRTRAWARGRRNRLISTICRRRWQHDNATGAVALLRSGYALPARGHGASKTYLSTGGKATYRDRNAVAENRATSLYVQIHDDCIRSVVIPDRFFDECRIIALLASGLCGSTE